MRLTDRDFLDQRTKPELETLFLKTSEKISELQAVLGGLYQEIMRREDAKEVRSDSRQAQEEGCV